MVISCAAYNCTNRQKRKDDPGNNIVFHRFPLLNKELLKCWKHAVKRANWEPTKYSFLCSDHFTADCYSVSNRSSGKRKRLKKDAVPSIFRFPEYLQKIEKSHPVLKYDSLKFTNTDKMSISDSDNFSNEMAVTEGSSGTENTNITTSETTSSLQNWFESSCPVTFAIGKILQRRKIKLPQSTLQRRKKKNESPQMVLVSVKKKKRGMPEASDSILPDKMEN